MMFCSFPLKLLVNQQSVFFLVIGSFKTTLFWRRPSTPLPVQPSLTHHSFLLSFPLPNLILTQRKSYTHPLIFFLSFITTNSNNTLSGLNWANQLQHLWANHAVCSQCTSFLQLGLLYLSYKRTEEEQVIPTINFGSLKFQIIILSIMASFLNIIPLI